MKEKDTSADRSKKKKKKDELLNLFFSHSCSKSASSTPPLSLASFAYCTIWRPLIGEPFASKGPLSSGGGKGAA